MKGAAEKKRINRRGGKKEKKTKKVGESRDQHPDAAKVNMYKTKAWIKWLGKDIEH